MARFRLGNEARANEYRKEEGEVKCRLCGSERETMEHIFRNREITGTGEGNWETYLREDTRSLGKLNEIIWKRKRKNIDEREANIETPEE